MAAAYLVIGDLEKLIGTAKIEQYFDDDVSGDITAESAAVAQVLAAAEAEASSRMMRSWSLDAITDLANNDDVFKNHVAWVGCELASERRTEFLSDDGKGAYWTQYERALQYFERLSKGQTRTMAEAVVGVGSNIGGIVQPARRADESLFVFAENNRAPRGQGSF